MMTSTDDDLARAIASAVPIHSREHREFFGTSEHQTSSDPQRIESVREILSQEPEPVPKWVIARRLGISKASTPALFHDVTLSLPIYEEDDGRVGLLGVHG
jgi:hypothetical protein